MYISKKQLHADRNDFTKSIFAFKFVSMKNLVDTLFLRSDYSRCGANNENNKSNSLMTSVCTKPIRTST